MPTEKENLSASELLKRIMTLDEEAIDAVLLDEGVNPKGAVDELRARMAATLGTKIETSENNHHGSRPHISRIPNAERSGIGIMASEKQKISKEDGIKPSAVLLRGIGSLDSHAMKLPQLGHLNSSASSSTLTCYIIYVSEILHACGMEDYEEKISGELSLMFRLTEQDELISLKVSSSIRHKDDLPLELTVKLTDVSGDEVTVELVPSNSAKVVKGSKLCAPIEKACIDVEVNVRD